MPRLAFIQFYPNDWLAEPSVRACSLAARGLWIDMLSLMHLSPRRGYLLSATGTPHSTEQLARLTGCSADEVSRLIAELQSSGCFSCTDDGTIFSRRMVKDESKRRKCSEAGQRGGLASARTRTLEGQPKGDGKGQPKGEGKLPETRDHKREEPPFIPPPGPPPPSKQSGEDVQIPPGLDSGPFPVAWREWLAERRSRGNRVSVRAAGLQLKKLEPLGPVRAAECVRASIANGWIGVFPERFTGTGGGVSATNGKPKYESPAERDVREFRERLAVVAQTKLQMEEERHGGPDADGPCPESWDAIEFGPGGMP